MYPETGCLFPYFDDSNASMASSSIISEYYLGGEGDLFKAPEPIMGIDPMSSTMISCRENDISSQVSDIESIQCDQLLSEVFYECKKDILAKEATETPPSEVFNIKINPFAATVNQSVIEGQMFPKSMSTGCLSSVEEWTYRRSNFNGVADFGAVYGMRRAFSDGDIEALGNDNVSLINSQQPQIFSSFSSEDRRQKLSRYWNKKSKRNFVCVQEGTGGQSAKDPRKICEERGMQYFKKTINNYYSCYKIV